MLRALYARLDHFAQRLERLPLDHPRTVVAAGVAFALLACAALTQLVFANDYRVFFDARDPERAAHERSEANFTGSDSVNIVIAARQGDLFTPRALKAIADATEAAGAIPHAVRVDSLANHQHSYASGDDLVVEPLIERADSLSQGDVLRIRRIAMTEPAIQGRYLSTDGRTATIVATISLPQGDTKAMTNVGEAAARLKSRLAYAYPELTVATSGVVLLSHSFYTVTQSDMAKLVPVMTLLLAIGIAAFFRSAAASGAAMLSLGLPITVTVGIAAAAGVAMSPASAQAPIIVLTIATAEAIHIIGSVLHFEREGLDRRAAIARALRVNHAAIFLTTLTDLFGFLSFNFSDTPPFRDLGNLCALGAVIAYVYSMLFLPALLNLWRFRASTAAHAKEQNVTRVAAWSMRNARVVLVGIGVLTLGLGSLWPSLETRDNFIEWLSPGQSFREDAEFINARMPGIYTMTYALDSGEEGGIAEPDYLRRVAAFQRWLAAQPEVADVASVADVMKRLNRNMNGDLKAHERLPDSRALAAQYLVLYEMSLSQGKDLADQITPDKRASRVIVVLNDVSSEAMVDIKLRADAWLKANTPAAMHAPGTGTSLMFAFLTERNTNQMVWGTATALLTIAVATGLALLSARMGLISLLPALAPVAMAFGAWALLLGEQGLYAAFVISCSLGLTVDAVTHFTLKFHKAWREGEARDDAVLTAYRQVGMELWVATTTLTAGFLLLSFSDFAIIARLGQMVALIFAFSLATTFIMLPALIRVMLPERAPLDDAIDEAQLLEPAAILRRRAAPATAPVPALAAAPAPAPSAPARPVADWRPVSRAPSGGTRPTFGRRS